jgi:hypothetical protein
MFSLLAVGAGMSYFVLGWSSNTVSFVGVDLRAMFLTTNVPARISRLPTARNTFKTFSPNPSLITTTRIILWAV